MKKKILLVEGVRSILEREKSMLNRDNFQVFAATGGEEAIEMHRREAFDVIVMDMQMPGLAGDEACRRMRADPALKKAAVLIAVMGGDEAEMERCARAGADGCIRKPVNKEVLSARLAKLLGVPDRQAIRILVRVKLDGKLDGQAGSAFFIANTVDVSATGLLFECDREFKVGDFLETSFYLPAGDGGFNRVVARSEVVRATPGAGGNRRYGVRFAEFREGSGDAISRFVAKKSGRLNDKNGAAG